MRATGTFSRNTKRAFAALGLLILVASYAACDAVPVAAKKRDLPIYSVARDDNKIAISFDAAWGGDKTPGILDILDEFGIKTTFFLVDIWTQRFPELTKEIVARGHELGNHSTTHAHMSKLSESQMAQELKVMSDNAEALTGTRPTLFRPPYGEYDDRVVATARREGYTTVQWSVDSLDWKNKGKEDLVRRSTQKVQSGDIVLFHNDSQYILEALPDILRAYAEQGWTVVPVSELLLSGETNIDHTGKQWQNN